MLVEDNETDRWFFSEVLRSRGNTVVACSSGEDALTSFDERLPELVMLDLGLPGIGGLEVCRRLRELPHGDRPFVIVVTSTEEGSTLDEVLAVGADDYIRKPIDAAALVIRLEIAERRIIDRRSLHRAESALVLKTREMEALFNNIQDVFFSLDLATGELIQVSPATQGLFGLSPGELTADPHVWRRLLIPPNAPWEPGSERVAEGSHVLEYGIDGADGERRWIRASVQIDIDRETGGLRADGLLVDITREHAARGELAERNRELETLHRLAELSLSAESLDAAYAQMLELISGAMGCSVTAIEALDRERDRLIITAARGMPDEARGRAIPLHRTLSGQAIRSGKPVLADEPASRSEHTDEMLVELGLKSFAAFPLMAAGAPVGTLMLGHTESVRMDQRFEQLGQSLATTLATYVERLEAEEAIRQSEARHRALAAELKQANQELESFAYSVSHDLRAPLRTMQGFAHALVQNYGAHLPGEARDFARRIIASGEQSERLISDLLAYSRLSFERLELQPVDLKSVIDQAREQVQHDLDQSEAHIQITEPLPKVRGNLTALVQAVANLLSNAVKFVPAERKPEVRIRADEDAGKVRLWVEDNGVGIPEGQEERIFRVFERLAETGDRPGTGIGLAVVRLGDRIAVVGGGVVGCLAAALAARHPAARVEMIDVNPRRRHIAEALGAGFALPDAAASDADLVIHASGTAGGLGAALQLAAFEATVLDLSWYGDAPVAVPLGENFHSRRLVLRSSQVGAVSPARRANRSRRDRLRLALELLRDPVFDALLTGESAFDALPETMARLVADPGDTLCHVVTYD